jgi:CXXX repeat peptide maturase
LSSLNERLIEHLLVLADRAAVSFCHYDNPPFHGAPPRWIKPRVLEAVVRYATKHQTALTFVLGRTRPPAEIDRVMNQIPHVKIVPVSLSEDFAGAIVVLSSDEGEAIENLKPNRARNLILRVERRDLPRCAEIVAALSGKYGRLSLHLVGIEYFTGDDLAVYADELEKISGVLKKLFTAGARVEVNVLSDRMMLRGMRNCDAGVKHITVATDGKCYICPAFLADGEAPIGSFDEKQGVVLEPLFGLKLADGPLCSRCDAWHCKRCVWLNRKLTLEINVPSEQQCLIAHAEREASRILLKELKDVEPFRRLPRIVELNYRDPLELIDMPPVEFPVQSSSDDPML